MNAFYELVFIANLNQCIRAAVHNTAVLADPDAFYLLIVKRYLPDHSVNRLKEVVDKVFPDAAHAVLADSDVEISTDNLEVSRTDKRAA